MSDSSSTSIAWGSAGMLFTSRVTREDLTITTKIAQGHFEIVIIILKQFPPEHAACVQVWILLFYFEIIYS